MNDGDIKLLKSIVKVHNTFLKGCKKETITEREIQAIENLLKENKELKSKLIIAKGGSDYWCQKYCEVSNNSVLVTKVEEKIEKLDKEEKQQLKGTKGQDRYAIKQEFMYKRNILQELLEVK